jgi:hypothetical protein
MQRSNLSAASQSAGRRIARPAYASMFTPAGQSSNKNVLSLFDLPIFADCFDLSLEKMASPRPSSTKAILFENKRKEIAYPRSRSGFTRTCPHPRKFLNDRNQVLSEDFFLREHRDIMGTGIAHR